MNGIDISVYRKEQAMGENVNETTEVTLQTTFNEDGFEELFEESEVKVDNVYTENNETVK